MFPPRRKIPSADTLALGNSPSGNPAIRRLISPRLAYHLGTSSSGPIDQPTTLASFSEAREIFGLPDDAQRPEDGAHPLTLVRALQFIYNNGASSVIAVRVAGSSASAPRSELPPAAVQPRRWPCSAPRRRGTWANDMQISMNNAEQDARISETQTSGFTRLKYARVVISAENRRRITRGDTRPVD